MSLKRQLVKIIKITSKKLKYSLFVIKKQINWLLRTLFLSRRKRDSINAGFVLPTVAMVALVVVLLTTAILFRSFERSKNASNVRVNEAVLNASMPAVDRATSKLEQLLNDPSLPRSTPTDVALYDVIKSNTRYDFGDETRLKLAYNFNGTAGIQTDPTLENNETLTTAWKFPVDTDNNGKFDSFTIYSIYFRSPPRNTSNLFSRARKPLDARTPPMDKSQVGGACAEAVGTSASLVGDSSWYKSGGNLAKSFFVYTANVPIDNLSGLDSAKYEKGNRGFSALEYQQDRERIPVNNKAVWFENDLEISPGSDLLLNGSVHTNSNLLAGGQYSGVDIVFRQVSSKNSCYYEPDNAKITIGGNLGTGNVSQTVNKEPISVHLFRGYKVNPWTADQTSPAVKIKIAGGTDHKSTSETGGKWLGHNDAAYNKRITLMKETALGLCTNCATQTTIANLTSTVQGIARYPQDIKSNFVTRISQSTGLDVPSAYGILGDEIELYLRNRTRRVPFKEVNSAIPTDTQALGTYTASNVFPGSTEIEVPAAWREITTTNTGLTLSLDKLPATEPEKQKDDGKENYSGDRVLIGNNLPAFWKNSDNQYVTGQKARQPVDGGTTKWNDPNIEARTRASQIQPQLNLGVTDRNDFWEQKAVEDNSANPLSNVGGLRVITGAGIYVDDDGASGTASFPRSANSFLSNPALDTNFVGTGAGKMPTPTQFKDAGTAQANILVWPDTMPMTGAPGQNPNGDLLMRATAVYHFKDNAGTAQTPIACVSSYYDPTNNITAQNLSTLTASWKYPSPADQSTTAGKSNNGIVYAFPGRTISSANLTILKRQARLVFPNGRIANEPLRRAMEKYTSNSNAFTNFTMEDYSAVDTALCALSIRAGATPATGANLKVPHGAIREATFLDAREVKALQKRTDYQTGSQGEYNLDLEQRQPLEIRVTEIDLGRLASTTIATSEYLLPKSGIIYATRDDALPDLSYKTIESGASADKALLFSQTDFKLDPTRRPNGIRLINGSNLARGGTNSATYNPSEKGLILVSNAPVYVKGNFNLHQTPSGTAVEEFSDYSETNSSQFYNRATFNSNFACRPGRGACPSTDGDVWRPSTILADSITLLSGDFQDGFRNHGDYDLRDNASSIPDAQLVNNFVTSANWASSTGYPLSTFKTSYLANGVTPIQRRTDFNEYLMEVCVKVPATTCGDGDWYIKPGTTGALKVSDITADGTVALDITNTHQAGTTAQPAVPQYQSYARRVAFVRDINNKLLDSSGTVIADATAASTKLPVPIGIDSSGRVQKYPYSTFNTSRPRSVTNKSALWFKTTNRTASPIDPTSNEYYAVDQPLFLKSRPFDTQQPQLVPVLQIYSPEGTPSNAFTPGAKSPGIQKEWVQKVSSDTIFNSSFVSGNSPSRPEEESAGLQNFVRFLEFWGGDGSTQYAAKIRGSFIQFKRSSYATAPFASITTADATATSVDATNNRSFFDFPYMTYWTNKGSPEGTTAYYTPPNRDWGFDVALLSQLPDLFAQRFTVPQAGPPAEYFREVGRDDDWVKTLLCAAQGSSYAVPSSYRPSNCPSTPYP